MMNAFPAQQNRRKHFIEIDVDILSYFGIESLDIKLLIPIPNYIRTKIRSWLMSGIAPEAVIVAIHPGTRKKMRRWEPERYAQIAYRLHEHYGISVILMGGIEEEELLDEIENKIGFAAAFKSCNLSLFDMAAVFSECQLFIGNDSGPGHIAAAVGCPTLSLFRPNFPAFCKPYIASGEVIFKNIDCCGCSQEELSCTRPENTCMDMIEVDEVWLKAKMMLFLNEKVKKAIKPLPKAPCITP